MKRTHIALAISGLCGVALAWQISTTTTIPEPSHTAAASDSSINAIAPPSRVHALNLDVPPADTRRPETEKVLGFMVRKDRDCTLEVHHLVDADTSLPAEVFACIPTTQPDADPYESWDEQVLAGMAYGDAHAAEILGLRHVTSHNPHREALGLGLLYRSAALSGDLAVFRRAIGRRYAYMSINGEPQIDNLKQLLVFSRIGKIMGDPEAAPETIRVALRRADVPDEDVVVLEKSAVSILESMAAIQTQATGDFTIREALDNA